LVITQKKAEVYLRAEIKFHFRLYFKAVYFESLERPGQVFALSRGVKHLRFVYDPALRIIELNILGVIQVKLTL
jgi:hypothetical protein